MQPVTQHNPNIQHLIRANYQRMMAFEQAAFICDESSLKSFFSARADESENNYKELCSCLNVSITEIEAAAAQNNTVAQKITSLFTGKRNAIKILQSARMLEKTILSWYKSAIKELNSQPKEIVHIVANQYKVMSDAELQLQYL